MHFIFGVLIWVTDEQKLLIRSPHSLTADCFQNSVFTQNQASIYYLERQIKFIP